ncbi:GNAT family N-acetyltransferase [Desulfovibrio ferrophilus]|uniref:Putative acetyltransferase, GNAT family n=1 Tax=Desulfovibrio ferrophilus TaxID=241368 RepID=A0A2Z6B398_9BACT|nr:GNAT family N-acetyltransferase [Desulfovibrio ferrophilus]BBD09896.1 putative acetyltransferase, GNAT family [Desulfovibrio ferrophilus]
MPDFTFTHRPLETSDLPALCSFPRTAEELFFMFPKANWPVTPGQLGEAAAQRREPTVFLCDETIAGYANILAWEHGNFCEAGNVVVAPAMRRRGLASHMMQTMEVKARDNYAARRLKVSCFSMNVGGLLLYSRLGFLPTGIAPRNGPNGAPHALIHLEKNIPGVS